MVTECDLYDLPLVSYHFTWAKGKGTEHVVEEQLDCALVSLSWLPFFLQVHLTNLIVPIYDHLPILLETQPIFHQYCKKCFRFEN